MSSYLQERLELETAIIANGQTTSGAINCYGRVLVGIITPAALTGTSFKIQVSYDGITYLSYYNLSGSELNIAVGANRHIGLLPADFAGAKFFKIISNSAEGAARTIKTIMRGM